MDADKINRLREERRKKKTEEASAHSNVRNSTVNENYNGNNEKSFGSELNIQDCEKEFKEIEERLGHLIQKGEYDEASQLLSYFYDSHKNQDVIGGEFYKTFGFRLNYWELYIDISRYETRIINNEHNIQSHSISNAERDIEKSLKDLQTWIEYEDCGKKIEELHSRYENVKISKDVWTKKNAEKEIKQLEETIPDLINKEDYDQASRILLDFYKTAEKTYVNHKDILTGEITFEYLYWNSYLNIKILEYYANPNNYNKEEVKKLKDQIDNDLHDLRMDKGYIETYPSRITSLYKVFEEAKEHVKKHNKEEKSPWSVGCGGAVIVFIIVLICKWIWDWGNWTLWVWPLVAFIVAFIGEMSDD